ncbi:uncharacterized protein [Macaca nemestrina]|uniref:uncharacterized protein n=1 Tax=Macaca nemestrina TaxID=9545 RepID=UPI0039B96858
MTVPASAAVREGEVGTPLEEVKPSSLRPPGREGARELGLETRIQHPDCAQASLPPTPLLLCDPRTDSLFSRSAGFPGPLACWARARSQEPASGHHAAMSGCSALAAGPTPPGAGVHAPPPLRGVRAPRSSPNGNPGRLGAKAGEAGRGAARRSQTILANLGPGKGCQLAYWERLWGQRSCFSARPLGREGSSNQA